MKIRNKRILGMQELQAINKKVEELRMEIIIRRLVALGIVFLTSLIIGYFVGIIHRRKERTKGTKKKTKSKTSMGSY